MFWGRKDVIAVGGGKGGIGKSSFVVNLGVAIAQKDKRVVLVDADIGAANLHTIIGVSNPGKTLDDFLQNPHMPLDDCLIDTPYRGLKLLSSASDVMAIASPNYRQRQKIYSGIKGLKTDVVIFDMGAGTQQRTTDFFGLAPIGIIIIEPIPTSLENAFTFLKSLLFRHLLRIFYKDDETRSYICSALDPKQGNADLLQFGKLLHELAVKSPEKIASFMYQYQQASSMLLVANAIRDSYQEQVSEKFVKIVKRYLSLNMRILGNLPYEQNMDVAISQRTPFVVKFPQSRYAAQLEGILGRVPLRS